MRPFAAALVLCALIGACGKLPETDIPTGLPNPPGPSIPPVPAPTPTPSATPTAPASASPGPTPAPSASPTPSGSCRLPSMPECGKAEGPPGVFGCCREESAQLFASQVDAAITQLQRDRPSLFSGERVLDANAYVQGVAQVLEQRYGLCARQGGPEDEVGVKNSNSFSEQYDILFGNGTIRHNGYTVTCRPARF